MDRNEVLRIIDAAYAARATNDPAQLAGFWAEGATFEIAGNQALLAAVPGVGGAPGKESVAELMGLVEFLSAERVDALVEGNRAAVLWRATVRFAEREPLETMLYDLIEIDESGKLRSVLQFIDTAQVAVEMQALAR